MQKIAVHSVPRSGSTWLGNIFNSHPDVVFKYQPLFSYAFKDYLTDNSSDKDICSFFDKIAKTKDVFMDQSDEKERGIVPKFLKNEHPTHICYKEVRYHNILENIVEKSVNVKFILLIRNPLAVLYSWKNAPKEFRAEKGWSFDAEWRNAPSKNLNLHEEYNGFEKWKEASYLFLDLQKRYSKKVLVLEYNDLLQEPELTIQAAFKFVNLEFNPQTAKFLEDSTSKNMDDSYSVFKIREKDTDWKNLPENIINYVRQDLNGTSLEKYL
ncbi:MAG: sulfotransferase [Flavobacteriaceae bacterium]